MIRFAVRPFPGAALLAGAALAATLAHGPVAADGVSSSSAPAAASCAAPPALTSLQQPLPRLANKLRAGDPIRIMALGSSSTAGAGASTLANSYPSRLEVELRTLVPNASITVINRGVNGDEAEQMLMRFEKAVDEDKPDLILWQVGSNALLRDHPLEPSAKLINQGVARMKQLGADVVLIDPQFAPKVLAKVDVDGMVELIETAAKHANVNAFRRFATMRYWRQTANIPYRVILSEDELHMNDWSYGCLAKLLARSIAEASNRSTVTATAVAPAR
jgi:lysophospholipase L1-like esterase